MKIDIVGLNMCAVIYISNFLLHEMIVVEAKEVKDVSENKNIR